MRSILLLLSLGLFLTVHGQPSATGTAGSLRVQQSDAIKGLMKDYSESRAPLKGYRVQIFLGNREQAEELRRNFLGRHPGIPAYLSYLAPNFRVRVGDQRDRVSAEKLREELRNEYPGLYVVPDEIQPPLLTPAP